MIKINISNEDKKQEKTMIEKKTWQDFQKTGLLMFINEFLHIFGWAIVFEYDKNIGFVKDVYPARVKFRGFGDKSQTMAYQKLTTYLENNINRLKKEAYEEDDL